MVSIFFLCFANKRQSFLWKRSSFDGEHNHRQNNEQTKQNRGSLVFLSQPTGDVQTSNRVFTKIKFEHIFSIILIDSQYTLLVSELCIFLGIHTPENPTFIAPSYFLTYIFWESFSTFSMNHYLDIFFRFSIGLYHFPSGFTLVSLYFLFGFYASMFCNEKEWLVWGACNVFDQMSQRKKPINNNKLTQWNRGERKMTKMV